MAIRFRMIAENFLRTQDSVEKFAHINFQWHRCFGTTCLSLKL